MMHGRDRTGRGRRARFGGRTLFASSTRPGARAWAACGLLTAGLVAGVLLATAGEGWHGAAVAVFALAAPLLIWIDLAEQRLPDLVVIPLLALLIVLTVAAGLAESAPGRVGAAFVGLGLMTALFGAMFLAAPASLGFGDVKLAPSVGLVLGWHGWQMVVMGVVVIVVLGVVHGLAHAVRIRRLKGAHVAFGPAMVVAPLLLCMLVSGL